MTGWNDVSVQDVTSEDGRDILTGDRLKIRTKVKLGNLQPDDVTVEAYYGILDHHGDFAERDTEVLELKSSDNGIYTFEGQIPCRNVGRFGFTVRIMPSRNRLENRFIMGLVTWA